MPISTVIGPVMDQVVVLLIGLPPSTPNPWSAQIRPNTARITPSANVTTKVLLIQGAYAPDLVSQVDAASERRRIVAWSRRTRIEVTEPVGPADRAGLVILSAFGGDAIGPVLDAGAASGGHHRGALTAVVDR